MMVRFGEKYYFTEFTHSMKLIFLTDHCDQTTIWTQPFHQSFLTSRSSKYEQYYLMEAAESTTDVLTTAWKNILQFLKTQ